MDGALKFVKPEGLSHTVEGGANSAGLSSMARSLMLSGTQPLSPKGGRETREDFDLLGTSESSEKRLEELSDATEEALVTAPAAIALGAGQTGKSCVLGSRRSKSPIREMIVGCKGMILKC